ncbi:protein of unknown function [Streptomyces murinus]
MDAVKQGGGRLVGGVLRDEGAGEGGVEEGGAKFGALFLCRDDRGREGRYGRLLLHDPLNGFTLSGERRQREINILNRCLIDLRHGSGKAACVLAEVREDPVCAKNQCYVLR